mmetsp:Transcript_71267/g.185045  ORF Transcript_71267/g.185045 Transcript_71267/m.185045 type:complete len:251 (+) Transcript_71267:1219-1971(+)
MAGGSASYPGRPPVSGCSLAQMEGALAVFQGSCAALRAQCSARHAPGPAPLLATCPGSEACQTLGESRQARRSAARQGRCPAACHAVLEEVQAVLDSGLAARRGRTPGLEGGYPVLGSTLVENSVPGLAPCLEPRPGREGRHASGGSRKAQANARQGREGPTARHAVFAGGHFVVEVGLAESCVRLSVLEGALAGLEGSLVACRAPGPAHQAAGEAPLRVLGQGREALALGVPRQAQILAAFPGRDPTVH